MTFSTKKSAKSALRSHQQQAAINQPSGDLMLSNNYRSPEDVDMSELVQRRQSSRKTDTVHSLSTPG
jgi:hypothetical protein